VIAYILRRLLYVVPLVIGVSFVVFSIFESRLFGDPVKGLLSKYGKLETEAMLRADLGYDRPFLVRYWDFLTDVVTLNFGNSSEYHVPVTEMISRGMGPSLSITLPAFLVATTVAVSLSILCAAFRGRILDRGVVVAAVALMSISSLVYIIVGQYLLAHELGLFPTEGYERGPGAWRFVALPVIIFVFLTIGPDLRFYRTAMLEEVKQDYVRTAKAKGVAPGRVLFVHVLRNGMIPILTRVVVELPFLFVGSILLEKFFNIPGLGGITIQGVLANDRPVVQAMTFIFAILLIVGNLLTDIAYTIADPRVRLG
jgi:peptide/nickel transport system permease protein